MTIIVKNITTSFGGVGGAGFNDFRDIIDVIRNPQYGGSAKITKINVKSVAINSGAIVDSLQFIYNIETETGAMNPFVGSKCGGDGRFSNNVAFTDDDPLVRITGTFGKFGDAGDTVILSIKFQTARRTLFYGAKNPADGTNNIEYILPQGVMFGSTIGKTVGSLGAIELETVTTTS